MRKTSLLFAGAGVVLLAACSGDKKSAMNDDLKKPEIDPKKKEQIAQVRQKKIDEWQELSKELQAFTQEQDKSLQDKTQRNRDLEPAPLALPNE